MTSPTRSRSVSLPSNATAWTAIEGLPGSWRRLRTRVAVSATTSDALVVDGTLVNGLQILRADRPLHLTVAGEPVDVVDDGAETLQVLPGRRCA